MKIINAIAILFLFLLNINLGMAQDCLEETKIEDAETNKKAAKALKTYCAEKEVKCKIDGGGLFGSSNYVRGEYLRHSFIADWSHKANPGKAWRETYVIVVVKTAKGCSQTILEVQQISLGGDSWGNPAFYDGLSRAGNEKYMKPKVDCDCVMKQKDWSKE